MRKVRILLVVCVVAVLVFTLAILPGCKTPTTTKTTAAAETTVAETTAGLILEPITVVMMSGFANVNEWEEKVKSVYPGEVNFVNLPENEMYTKIHLEVISGGTSYDVIFTPAGGAQQYGSGDMLTPLPPLEDEDDFFKGDVNQYKIGDIFYGYPVISDVNLLYYRTDLLKEAGFDGPPKTWDEFREMAIKLTVDKNGKHPDEEGFDPSNVEIYGSAFKGANVTSCTYEFWNYLYQNEGQAIKIDNANKTYEVTIDEPEAIGALQWLVDNYKKYRIYPEGIVNYDYSEFHGVFLEGRVAMEINWPYMVELASEKDSKVAGQFAVGLMPKGKVNASVLGGWSANILKTSTKLDSAVAFVQWMATKDAIDLICNTAYSTPPRLSLMEQRLTNASDDLDKMKWQAINDNLQYGRMMDISYSGVSTVACDKAISTVINEALAGQVTPEEGFKQVAVKIEEILESNKFMK
jgi:multiple sugar transport system substrate-binding protein